MNFTLLGKLIWAIQMKIIAAKQARQRYDFVEIKKCVFNVYKKEIGNDRELYSKAVCSHFGKLGAEAAKARRKEAKRLIAVPKEVLQIRRMQEVENCWLKERIREGSVGFSEDGDLILLEEIEEN